MIVFLFDSNICPEKQSLLGFEVFNRQLLHSVEASKDVQIEFFNKKCLFLLKKVANLEETIALCNLEIELTEIVGKG